jgi:hypothetical protein
MWKGRSWHSRRYLQLPGCCSTRLALTMADIRTIHTCDVFSLQFTTTQGDAAGRKSGLTGSPDAFFVWIQDVIRKSETGKLGKVAIVPRSGACCALLLAIYTYPSIAVGTAHSAAPCFVSS